MPDQRRDARPATAAQGSEQTGLGRGAPNACILQQKRVTPPQRMSRWGKKWGKNPHRLQLIPADLDLAKTA
jgi:hypothetical protein